MDNLFLGGMITLCGATLLGMEHESHERLVPSASNEASITTYLQGLSEEEFQDVLAIAQGGQYAAEEIFVREIATHVVAPSLSEEVQKEYKRLCAVRTQEQKEWEDTFDKCAAMIEEVRQTELHTGIGMDLALRSFKKTLSHEIKKASDLLAEMLAKDDLERQDIYEVLHNCLMKGANKLTFEEKNYSQEVGQTFRLFRDQQKKTVRNLSVLDASYKNCITSIREQSPAFSEMTEAINHQRLERDARFVQLVQWIQEEKKIRKECDDKSAAEYDKL